MKAWPAKNIWQTRALELVINPLQYATYETVGIHDRERICREKGREAMNEQQILTLIISASGVIVFIVLAVFSANWLAARRTDRLIDQLERRLNERDGRLAAELQAVRAEVKAQGEVLSAKLEALAKDVGRVEKQIEPFVQLVLPGTKR